MSVATAHPPLADETCSTPHEALQDVEHRWNAAALDWNADALTALYTHDAVFFGGRQGHAVGLQAIHSYFSSYIGVLKSARLTLFDQCVVELGKHTFLAQGYANLKFVLGDGSETSSILRTTWVLVRRQGNWKLLQHHFSPTPEVPPIR